MISKKYAIAEINSLSRDDFVQIVGPVFEHSPWIAEATWPKRPFADLESLYHTLCQTVKAASQEKQLALIRAHPDLVGRAASKESPSPPTAPLSRSDSAREGGVGGEGQKSGTLTPQSSSEQATAGLDRLTADEIASFQNLNRAYRERFGFPFVICARLNKKEAILGGFEKRLKNVREQEIKTALDEIAKIAWLRLQDLMKNDK